MVKYVGSFVGGILVGFAFLAMSSCVEKKPVTESLDAGSVEVVESGGTMTTGVPTISSVPTPAPEAMPVTESK